MWFCYSVCVHWCTLCVHVHGCVWVGEGGGDIHRHTGKEPQGSVNVVLLQCMCTLYMCVPDSACLCVGWGGRGETYIDILVRNHKAQ